MSTKAELSHNQTVLNSTTHLDVYLNFNCNLRCKHCFVGEELEKKINFSLQDLYGLLNYARDQGVNKLTYLGGEPTIYPYISEAIDKAKDLNFEEIRIVTNGTKPLEKVINKYSRSDFKPTIIFSLDSTNKENHNKIRGPRTFEKLKKNISLANKLNFKIAGITSINSINASDVQEILTFAENHNFRYLNFHLVTNRGFANKKIIVSPEDWIQIRKQVVECSKDLSYPIKFERKFIPTEEFQDLPSYYDECFVNEKKEGNVMIMPDGRVYKCALFLDENKLHSHTWTGKKIKPNTEYLTESDICKNKCTGECPGLKTYSSDLYNEEKFSTICMYRKEIIENGKVYLFS